MTNRPILFSGPMVRAILAGAKTQTRRLVDMRGLDYIGPAGFRDDPAEWGYYADEDEYGRWCVLARGKDDRHHNGQVSIRCPHGVPGDRLWVRETFRPVRFPGRPVVGIHYVATENPHTDALVTLKLGQHYNFPDDVGTDPQWPEGVACKTRPSIFMPRWASRLTLEVTEVRVQRLQDINGDDIAADMGWLPCDRGPACRCAHDMFAPVWDRIYGKRAPWDSNQFVWAITFRRIS